MKAPLPRRALPLIVAALALIAFSLPAIVSAGQLRLPKGVTEAQAKQMYAEQLDSQNNIERLVGNEVESFTINDRSVASGKAELKLTVKYRNGLTQRGTMRLFKADKVWYFKSITRHQVDEVLPKLASYDVGVLNTMLAEQVVNADVTEKLVDGTYKTITIGRPKRGYRSVEIPVTFAGAAGKAKVLGSVTCISKTSRGESTWFITGFNR